LFYDSGKAAYGKAGRNKMVLPAGKMPKIKKDLVKETKGVKFMGRKEARAKGWNTFRESIIQRAKEHPEFSLTDFILQRIYDAYAFWREARAVERRRDYKNARALYLKTVESLEQAEKLLENPAAAIYVDQLKSEYFDFVVHRDPYYRQYLKYFLPVIKAEPGILQTDMYKRFNVPRSEITYTLYFAEKEGLIRREQKGRSYQLFFDREKAADEPLLSIQEDEIDIREKTEEAEAVKKGCLFVFSCIFWAVALVGIGAIGGLIGAGLVVAAFITWQITRRICRKKRSMTKNAQKVPQAALPVNPAENKGNDEKSPVMPQNKT
jgi:hypothetical protein